MYSYRTAFKFNILLKPSSVNGPPAEASDRQGCKLLLSHTLNIPSVEFVISNFLIDEQKKQKI